VTNYSLFWSLIYYEVISNGNLTRYDRQNLAFATIKKITFLVIFLRVLFTLKVDLCWFAYHGKHVQESLTHFSLPMNFLTNRRRLDWTLERVNLIRVFSGPRNTLISCQIFTRQRFNCECEYFDVRCVAEIFSYNCVVYDKECFICTKLNLIFFNDVTVVFV